MQHWQFFRQPVYAHLLSHNGLYLRETLWLYMIDMWTAVCFWSLSTENRSHAVWELKKWSVREREHLYQQDSAYHAFTNFKLIDNELWLPGKMGCLVTQSLTLGVLRSLFQIASSCFGSLSVHCGCHTEVPRHSRERTNKTPAANRTAYS